MLIIAKKNFLNYFRKKNVTDNNINDRKYKWNCEISINVVQNYNGLYLYIIYLYEIKLRDKC